MILCWRQSEFKNGPVSLIHGFFRLQEPSEPFSVVKGIVTDIVTLWFQILGPAKEELDFYTLKIVAIAHLHLSQCGVVSL